jgi:hypothetical protein
VTLVPPVKVDEKADGKVVLAAVARFMLSRERRWLTLLRFASRLERVKCHGVTLHSNPGFVHLNPGRSYA